MLTLIFVTVIIRQQHNRTPDYIAKAFKKTGILPFTRATHLEGNCGDVQLGDALMAAQKMLDRQREREARGVAQTGVVEDNVVPVPMRQAEITEISKVFGTSDIITTNANKHALVMWPEYEATSLSPDVWRRCIQLSPKLNARLDATDRDELLKFFDVGLLLDEHMKNITAAQALILGYVYDTG